MFQSQHSVYVSNMEHMVFHKIIFLNDQQHRKLVCFRFFSFLEFEEYELEREKLVKKNHCISCN